MTIAIVWTLNRVGLHTRFISLYPYTIADRPDVPEDELGLIATAARPSSNCPVHAVANVTERDDSAVDRLRETNGGIQLPVFEFPVFRDGKYDRRRRRGFSSPVRVGRLRRIGDRHRTVDHFSRDHRVC